MCEPMKAKLPKTAAVVVTYCTGDNSDLWLNLCVLLTQFDNVFVVDNSPEDCLFGLIGQIKEAYGNRLNFTPANPLGRGKERNVGLAGAQNIGARLALEAGAEWIAFFDQDSCPSMNFVSSMFEYYSALPDYEKKRVLALGPRIYDVQGNFFCQHVVGKGRVGFRRVHFRNGKGLNGLLFIISSGSFIPAATFRKLGFFREDFFIDYVDNEFCLRGVSKGLRIHVVRDAVLFHRLGNRKVLKVASITMRPTFHPPWRRYTIYRNRSHVWKLYWKKVPSFVVFDLLAMVYDLLRITATEDAKREKFLSVFKGLFHGLKTPCGRPLPHLSSVSLPGDD